MRELQWAMSGWFKGPMIDSSLSSAMTAETITQLWGLVHSFGRLLLFIHH